MKNLSDLKKLLGENIRFFRKLAGLTQEELADRVQLESGPYISFIENGKRWPRAETLSKIAKVLKVKVRDLLDEERGKSIPKDKTFEEWMERLRLLLKGKDKRDIEAIYDFIQRLGERK